MKKYFSIISLNFLNQKNNQKEIIIRASFYLVIIYIFSCLWNFSNLTLESIEAWRIPWYIAITETIILANPIIYFDIECDIRSGDIAYHLTRPINYLSMRIYENLAIYSFRFIFLSLTGLLFCSIISSSTPSLYEILTCYTLAFFAGISLLIWHSLIGLTAFWLQDCTPLFWLWQRSSFLLGGLLLPLDFYPEFLQNISQWTPFAALIYSPAKQILFSSSLTIAITFSKILLWGSLAIFICFTIYKRAIQQLQINGG